MSLEVSTLDVWCACGGSEALVSWRKTTIVVVGLADCGLLGSSLAVFSGLTSFNLSQGLEHWDGSLNNEGSVLCFIVVCGVCLFFARAAFWLADLTVLGVWDWSQKGLLKSEGFLWVSTVNTRSEAWHLVEFAWALWELNFGEVT